MSWVSGPCDPDDGPGTFIVFEDRPEDSTEPPVVRSGSGNVIWVDSGSGPGYEVPKPADQQDD